MRKPLTRKSVSRRLGLALAIPAVLMAYDVLSGRSLAMDMLEPSGELSVRLMILALLPGPLVELFGGHPTVGRLLRGWLSFRRNLGVAAFAYGVLHLAFYALDMTPAGVLAELPIPSIATGWLALLLMAVPAAISFDAAVRALRRRWQRIQYLVYPAALLAAAHWLLLDWHWPKVALHFVPLGLAWLLRWTKRRGYSARKGLSA